MKKAIVYLMILLNGVPCAFAQKDAQAKAILSQISAKYRSYNSIKTDFTFVLDNPQAGASETQSGILVASSKTGKYKITLFNPGSKTDVEQEIISDGKTQWTYLKRDKEVQINNAASGDDNLNPAKLFTMYERGYKYVYTGLQKVNGKTCQVVDLSPEDANKTFFKVRLMVDKIKKQLYSAQLFDKGASRYTYTLNTLTPNVPMPESTFTFNVKEHPGVEVVDLR